MRPPTAADVARALDLTLDHIFVRHWFFAKRLRKADNDNHFDEGPRYA